MTSGPTKAVKAAILGRRFEIEARPFWWVSPPGKSACSGTRASGRFKNANLDTATDELCVMAKPGFK